VKQILLTPVHSKVSAKPDEHNDPEASLSSIKQTEPDVSLSSHKQMEPEVYWGASYDGMSIVPPSAPQNNPAFDVKQTISKPNPYPVIKNNIPELANALLDLPDCPVWIHEKELCKITKMPSGNAFGQRHSLSCLL